MEFIVTGTFHSIDQAQRAREQLATAGFPLEQLEFQVRSADLDDPSTIPNGYDPIGGARFAGTPIRTLSTTGHDLVGNSTTLDTGLDSIRDVLAKAASDEADKHGSTGVQPRVDFVFKTDGREAATTAEAVFKRTGAKGLKVSPV